MSYVELQREIAALPVAQRAKARERVLRMLHRQIAEYDPDFAILTLILESQWVADNIADPSRQLVYHVRILEELERVDPDYGVREAYHWIRSLLNDCKSDVKGAA